MKFKSSDQLKQCQTFKIVVVYTLTTHRSNSITHVFCCSWNGIALTINTPACVVMRTALFRLPNKH